MIATSQYSPLSFKSLPGNISQQKAQLLVISLKVIPPVDRTSVLGIKHAACSNFATNRPNLKKNPYWGFKLGTLELQSNHST